MEASGTSFDADEQLYRWLADQLDILAYRARPGEDRVVSHLSPGFRATLGYTARELCGRDFAELVHPEDRDRASRALAGARDPDGGARADYRLVTRDDRILWVTDESVLGRDDRGRPLIRGYVRDDTDDRVAADAVLESQTRMRLLAEQLPAVVWTTDSAGNLTSILGRAATHLRLGVDDFPGEATGEPHRRALAGERVGFEAEWNGRAFEAHVEPLDGAAGASGGVIGIAMDVTDRRRAAERLRESEQRLETARKMEAVGRLAGGVAHDFSNLLTSILGNAHLLVESLDADDQRRDEAQRIKTVAERGVSLIEQLLAFARRQVLEPRVLDINAVVAGMEDVLVRLLADDVRVALSLRPSALPVRIDPAALEQIVMNLVVNAGDAMPDGGVVTIETFDESDARRPAPAVVLVVSDTGTGMDQRTKSRIFEPFFTTKGAGRGTGLGLATVYGIVEQSGGEIVVESEPGRGARFRIAFPAAEGVADAAAPAGAGPASAGGGEAILLVEDDDEVRALARKSLERAGYVVVEARSAEQAIDAWRNRERDIELLLADVVLPGLDGVELAARLIDEDDGPCALLMSGFIGEQGLEERLAGVGAPILRKPFTPEALTREVRSALDARAAS